MSKAFRAFSDYSPETEAGRLPDKGFQMTFANGLTASVMFGSGNYCEVRNEDRPIGGSNTAEIMVWNAEGVDLFCDGSSEFDDDGNVICPQSDIGWKTTDDIAKALALIASFPSDISKVDAISKLHEII